MRLAFLGKEYVGGGGGGVREETETGNRGASVARACKVSDRYGLKCLSTPVVLRTSKLKWCGAHPRRTEKRKLNKCPPTRIKNFK